MKNDYTKTMESIIGNYSLSTINNYDGRVNDDNDIYGDLFEDLPHELECIDIEYDKFGDQINDIEEIVDAPDSPEEVHDKLLGMELSLPLTRRDQISYH